MQIIAPFRHHVSFDLIDESANEVGTTLSLVARVKGKLSQSGMLCNFANGKKWIKGLDNGFDHTTFITQGHPALVLFTQHGFRHTVVEGKVDKEAVIGRMCAYLENELHILGGSVEFDSLTASEKGGNIWVQRDENEPQITTEEKGNETFFSYFNLGHRLREDSKCRNPHAHRWTLKVEADKINTSSQQEIKAFLLDDWHNRIALAGDDELAEGLKKAGMKVKELSNNPTTEIIGSMMWQQVTQILGEGNITRLTLIETDSNSIEIVP